MSIAGEEAVLALACFEAMGLRGDELCAKSGVARKALSAPGTRIPRSQFDALFTAAAEAGGDRLVGLHGGMVRPPSDLLFFVCLSQSNVGEAMKEWVRLSHAVDDSIVARIVEKGDVVSLSLHGSDATSEDARRHEIEFMAGQIVQYIALATGGTARIGLIRFPHAPGGPVAEYEKTLRVPVEFRHNCFEFQMRRADLPVAVVMANADILRMTREAAEKQLRAAQSNSFRSRVELALRHRIREAADHSREGVAELLATSVSTLQRRLREENCSFRDVRDDVRRAVAEDLLTDGGQSVSEIAALLDFADVAAFGKAFRRWTGETPRDFRRKKGDGSIFLR